ncbi:MAG TPA: hypothetical protein VMX33_05465 [bacterium]|nr:hypothetical protein [bacterium]
MKKMLCAAVFAVALVLAANAQGAPLGDKTFDGRIDLRVGIARLEEIARTNDTAALGDISGGKTALLLFGTLSKPVIVSDEPFEADAQFLEGEWIGTAKLVLHRVFLTFSSDEYREFLDGASGKRTVVLARDPVIRTSPDGAQDVYLSVIAVRPIF